MHEVGYTVMLYFCVWNSEKDRRIKSFTDMLSTMIKFKIMLNVKRNCDDSFKDIPESVAVIVGRSGTSFQQFKMTVPFTSKPRRPARPLICVYSPGNKNRKSFPSCFRILLKIAVRAGTLTPIANVSVANRTLQRPLENRSSTTSFKMGSMPPW